MLIECIDFKEFVCGISAACRGPQQERYKCKLVFKKIYGNQMILFLKAYLLD